MTTEVVYEATEGENEDFLDTELHNKETDMCRLQLSSGLH
jgi:hypothetical protein